MCLLSAATLSRTDLHWMKHQVSHGDTRSYSELQKLGHSTHSWSHRYWMICWVSHKQTGPTIRWTLISWSLDTQSSHNLIRWSGNPSGVTQLHRTIGWTPMAMLSESAQCDQMIRRVGLNHLVYIPVHIFSLFKVWSHLIWSLWDFWLKNLSNETTSELTWESIPHVHIQVLWTQTHIKLLVLSSS